MSPLKQVTNKISFAGGRRWHDWLTLVKRCQSNALSNLKTGLASAEALEVEAGGRLADIYLIDINLPGEDGISLAARIRHAQPRRSM